MVPALVLTPDREGKEKQEEIKACERKLVRESADIVALTAVEKSK